MRTEDSLAWCLKGDKIDWEAYQRGMEDCHELKEVPNGSNPYKKNTVEWFSYNRGWNAYSPPKHNCILEDAQSGKCFKPCGDCRQNVC